MSKSSPKKEPAPDVLEQAMADALKSVERIERETGSEEPIPVPVEVVTDSGEGSSSAPEPPPDREETESASGDDAQNVRDQLLRMAADFDNFRKRARRERDELRKYATERVMTDLLPVIDNLERALAHAGDSQNPMVEGVKMVAKQFLDVLGTHGVRDFNCEGEVFDPERHEAMSQIPSPDAQPGTIISQLEKGYLLHDRLLRPAKVVVATAASKGSAPAPANGDSPEENPPTVETKAEATED